MMSDKRPVNPPDIVTIMPDGEGFSIDMNNMEVGQTYILKFQENRFEISKRDDEALLMRGLLGLRDIPEIAKYVCRRILRMRQGR